MVIGGGTTALIGCNLPWITVVYDVPGIVYAEVTRNLFSPSSHAPLPGVDGIIITDLALACVVLGMLILIGRWAKGAALVALLLSVVAGVTLVADFFDINGSIEVLRTVYFQIYQIGIGMYVTAIGVLIWAAGAGSEVVGRRRTSSDGVEGSPLRDFFHARTRAADRRST
jgi:uncharacterized membrane protein YphA (DoxX/SURF4 family)